MKRLASKYAAALMREHASSSSSDVACRTVSTGHASAVVTLLPLLLSPPLPPLLRARSSRAAFCVAMRHLIRALHG